MKQLLEKLYDHKLVEQNKYQTWLKKGYFKPKSTGNTFSIILPPPNVTGMLHIGHALNLSIQDIMLRYKKLNGFRTLWVPGTDHAGIATQTKFERHLKSTSKITKEQMGREEFINQLMIWKNEQSDVIHQQWEKLGLALDYSQEKFTLDEDVRQAVAKVFVDLYNNQLIYRSKKLINWDVKLETAISDIEVIHKPVIAKLYYIKYYLDKKFKKFITIATSRPETMFGDACVFVHPNDKRYKKEIGKQVYNPANGQWIPIFADRYIEIDFGTGAMKCTPAHDFNDYELAKRHNLEKINIMNKNGTMNELAGKYAGLDRLVCRAKLVEELVSAKAIVKIDEHYETKIGYSERTNEIVEPYLSNQWFLKIESLAQKVLANQKSKKANRTTTFIPKRFEKSLNFWLNNIQDWCISRQLWWGHRLPIWYHKKTNEVYVNTKPPLDIKNWTQDPDVLDTWFSSGLWPMLALNWPKQTKVFDDFFPTSILVTAYDILTFWVSRMMMLSTYFTDKTPFEKVYIHGLIRDEQGRKMSKSLNNGIEPMAVIDKYGADTLRLFLTSSSAVGEDLNFNEQKIKSNWSLLNKLWNSARFILGHAKAKQYPLKLTNKSPEICIWIMNRYNKVVSQVTKHMNDNNFVLATRYLTDFIWNDFCSGFIELSKNTILNNQYEQAIVSTCVFLLKQILIMLHPLCPFITEEIYLLLPKHKESIMKETWPKKIVNLPKENKVQYLISIIHSIRKIRAENKIKTSELLEINLLVKDNFKKLDNALEFINIYLINLNCQVKNISTISLVGNKVTEITPHFIIEIPFAKNNAEEIIKIEKLITFLQAEIKRCEDILANKNFRTKAPKSKIDEEENKLIKYQNQLQSAQDSLKNLKI